MATNEILPFAQGPGANVLTQAAYSADAQRPIGHQPGTARSQLANKQSLQSSLMASALAQYIADNQSNNVVDTASATDIATWLGNAVRATSTPYADAGGTANAITANFTPDVSLTNGQTVLVRAATSNTTTTPTFAPDGLTAKTIVKGANSALAAGDIAGAGHWLELAWDSTLSKWVLLNPATGVSGIASNGVAGYSANTTLTGADLGRACYASSASAITLTLPAIPASGKVILISNQGVGVVTVARAGLATIGAFGNVGLTFITLNYGESIALCSDGTNWFQMLGNQGAIGVGQAWQSVGGSRVAGTTYYNTTAKPIMVCVGMTTTVANTGIYATVSPGYTLWGSNSANSPYVAAISFIVPPGGSYSVQMQSGTTTILTWLELR